MKEMGCVELIVEKEEYAQDGVHKGMQGWICLPECCDGSWLVNFPQCGAKRDIATLGIDEGDLKLLPCMNPLINEMIRELHEGTFQPIDPKDMVCIEVTADQRHYGYDRIYKGMQGRICYTGKAFGNLLVTFPQSEGKPYLVTSMINENDMKIISTIDPSVNERIRKERE